MLVLIIGLFFLIIPQLYSSIETIVVNSPTYIDSLTKWATKMLDDYPEISSYVEGLLATVNTDIVSWLQTTILPKLGNLISNVSTGVRYVLQGVYNLVIGIIVSMYVLGNTEGFVANAKRLIYSIMSVDTAKKFLEILRFTDRTFIGFLNGKLVDSAIIGLICYIGCVILKMPYALLVSVLVGVTNIIPFFGPLIGAIPSAIIILMVDPFKCLIFIVFVILLQQLDGNIIGPKILGSSVGINGFWIMFSIIVGAGFFGFWGMLLGVPVFVVIYTIVNSVIDRTLRRNDLPLDEASYTNLDYIDPVTLQPIHHIEKEDEDE
jgi:predicted PurR-regulated permease PerM